MHAAAPRQRPGLPPAALLFATVLMVCAAMVLTISRQRGLEESALLRMSNEARQRVFDGALTSLRELCRQPDASPELEGRCHQQARFVSLFPECTGPCRDLVDANLATPTR